MKTLRACAQPTVVSVKGEHRVGVKEARGTKTTQVNACMATLVKASSLTEEMAAQSIDYHTHGTADGDKFCCYPRLVCHDSNALLAQAHSHDDKSSD